MRNPFYSIYRDFKAVFERELSEEINKVRPVVQQSNSTISQKMISGVCDAGRAIGDYVRGHYSKDGGNLIRGVCAWLKGGETETYPRSIREFWLRNWDTTGKGLTEDTVLISTARALYLSDILPSDIQRVYAAFILTWDDSSRTAPLRLPMPSDMNAQTCFFTGIYRELVTLEGSDWESIKSVFECASSIDLEGIYKKEMQSYQFQKRRQEVIEKRKAKDKNDDQLGKRIKGEVNNTDNTPAEQSDS